MTITGEVAGVAGRVNRNSVLRGGARLGYALSGVLHLLIAWITLQVAWSDSGRSADQSGALATLAGSSLGRLTLWVAVVGFVALAAWQLAIGLAARPDRGSSRWPAPVKGIAKAVLYLALGWASFNTAEGRPGNSRAQSAGITATLLQHSGGALGVMLIGLVLIGAGGYHMLKGWTKMFLRDLTKHPGRFAVRAGVVGYLAKGVSLALVGVLFVIAAQDNTSARSTGLDGALRLLRQQAFGPWLLTAVALGIAAYGLYSFARARHARV